MFANVTSRLTERQLQPDLCVHNSGGGGGENLFGCLQSENHPVDGWMAVRVCESQQGAEGPREQLG